MSDKVSIRCVGTGDAFGSGGRLNSCFQLAVKGEQLLLDCGCSSLIGLQRCSIDPAGIDTVVVSHLHGDHFGGIPFLLLEAKFVSRRQRPLTLIGPPGLQQQVEAALEALYPGTIGAGFRFPVNYRQLETAGPLQQGRCSRARSVSVAVRLSMVAARTFTQYGSRLPVRQSATREIPRGRKIWLRWLMVVIC